MGMALLEVQSSLSADSLSPANNAANPNPETPLVGRVFCTTSGVKAVVRFADTNSPNNAARAILRRKKGI
jgi:hypothetical protein